jgi:sporulation protein YlmC with PRC-barrel domain
MDKRNIDLDTLEGATVFDSENKKVGTVGQIYLDTNTDEPKFVTVNTGLFGTK